MDYAFIKDLISGLLTVGVIYILFSMAIKFGSTKVEITIEENSINLSTDKNKLILAPYLYLSGEGKKKRLLGVGSEDAPQEPHVKINLINCHSKIGEEEYYECVSAFFRFAFTKLIKRHFFVLPRITLTGAQYLKYNSHQNNNDRVYKAFRQAGAIECDFTQE